MDKKLKMWVAVGVVVILVVISGILYIMWLPKDNPVYKAEITMDVSQNETAYIILINSVEKKFFENDTVIEEAKLEPHSLLVYICRNNISWTRPLLYKTDDLGLNYIDINKNDYFDKEDMITINKKGGNEYTPKMGDEIVLKGDEGHISYIRSNRINIP